MTLTPTVPFAFAAQRTTAATLRTAVRPEYRTPILYETAVVVHGRPEFEQLKAPGSGSACDTTGSRARAFRGLRLGWRVGHCRPASRRRSRVRASRCCA